VKGESGERREERGERRKAKEESEEDGSGWFWGQVEHKQASKDK